MRTSLPRSAGALLLVVLSSACAARGTTTAPTPSATPKQLRVIAANDFHGHLAAEPASWSQGRPVGGAAALASYFKRERAAFTAGPTILLDGGDVMQGTPLSNLTEGRSTVAFFNLVGYSAAAIGNHEFDWGVPTLRDRMAQAQFGWLSANIHVAGSDTAPSWLKPTMLLTVQGVRVGVIGLTTQETPQTTHAEKVAGLTFDDGAAAMDRWVPELRRAGADFVIVVAHAGASCGTNYTDCRGEIIKWAGSTKARPDLIVAGHTHQVVQTVVNGIPIVESGNYGTRYNVVDLRRVTADSVDARVHPVVAAFADSIAPDAAAAALVEQYRKQIGPEVERVVGTAIAAIPRGAGENPMGRMIADAQREAANAQIAIMNSGGVRAGLDAGPITWSELYQVHPFGNRLILLKLSGAKLRAAIEHGVSGTDPQAQVSGLTVEYDPSYPVGRRIITITFPNGTPVRDDGVYDVVVNDFLATGVGDGFTALGQYESKTDLGIVDLDALLRYVQKHGQVSPPMDWRLRRVKVDR